MLVLHLSPAAQAQVIILNHPDRHFSFSPPSLNQACFPQTCTPSKSPYRQLPAAGDTKAISAVRRGLFLEAVLWAL